MVTQLLAVAVAVVCYVVVARHCIGQAGEPALCRPMPIHGNRRGTVWLYISSSSLLGKLHCALRVCVSLAGSVSQSVSSLLLLIAFYARYAHTLTHNTRIHTHTMWYCIYGHTAAVRACSSHIQAYMARCNIACPMLVAVQQGGNTDACVRRHIPCIYVY